MKAVLASLFALSACISLPGQSYPVTAMRDITWIVNELTEHGSAGDASLITEMLSELSDNKVFINSGDSAEISRLFFLSPVQTESLLNHIKRAGPIVSRAELASLRNFGRETAEMMLPFISFALPDEIPHQYGGNRMYHRVVLSVSSARNNATGISDWNPPKTNTRYRLSASDFSASLITSASPVEVPLRKMGSSFISAGVAFAGTRKGSAFIIGDYSARFGMGLTVNTGYRPFMTLTSDSYMGHRDGFALSSTINENNYLRGTAASVTAGRVTIAAMASVRTRDARLVTGSGGVLYADILSAPASQNTMSGGAANDALRETTWGINIGVPAGSFRWAFTACLTQFSHMVREEMVFNAETGSLYAVRSFNAGISYRMAMGRFTGAGEIALSADGAAATAHTLNVRFDDRLSANFICRYYGRNYFGHLAAGPGRNSYTANEGGFLARVRFEAARNLFISCGADIYSFPWLRYATSFPSDGFRSELKVEYNYRNSFTALFRISGGKSEGNLSRSYGVPGLTCDRQTTARASLSFVPLPELTITASAMSKWTAGEEPGTLLSVDAGYTSKRLPVSLWLRCSGYSTPGFDSGLYLYENDLLYGYSIPVHYGEGTRIAALIRATISGRAVVRIKYGIASRLNGIMPARSEELKFQIILSF